ncbi:hypothetical protein VIGAN_03097200, partial [Vigna angularis var. angularis]
AMVAEAEAEATHSLLRAMVAEETMGDQLGFSDLGFHGTMGDGWPRRRWAMVAEETMSDPLVHLIRLNNDQLGF